MQPVNQTIEQPVNQTIEQPVNQTTEQLWMGVSQEGQPSLKSQHIIFLMMGHYIAYNRHIPLRTIQPLDEEWTSTRNTHTRGHN